MFYFMEVLNFEIANYADDSTPFSAKLNHKSGVGELEISSSVLFIWFRNNYMKGNTDKSHILPSGSNQLTADIYGNDTESEDNQILLGITIGSNLSFNKQLIIYVKKTAQNLMLLLEYQVRWTFQNVG